jgi:1-acyl-sn-glycerol-3-phosphate acyltransferase
MNTFIQGSFLVNVFFATWRKRFRDYVSMCLSSGFVPYTFRPLQVLGKQLARLWMFIQVGRIRIEGMENLSVKGRIIFCPNHSSMFDAPIMFAVMKQFPRYMTAYEEMRGLWGLKAVLMGAFGSFPVDRSRGKTVLEPAINVLARGDPLVIFPEGKISPTGQYLPFKIGAALIAVGAYEKLNRKEKVAIVPVQICFAGRHAETACGPYTEMGLKWRKGAVVTAGPPVWIDAECCSEPENVINAVRMMIVERPCPTAFESV